MTGESEMHIHWHKRKEYKGYKYYQCRCGEIEVNDRIEDHGGLMLVPFFSMTGSDYHVVTEDGLYARFCLWDRKLKEDEELSQEKKRLKKKLDDKIAKLAETKRAGGC
jgi:hypothetical protein